MRSLLSFTIAGLLLSSTIAMAEPSDLIYLGDLPGGSTASVANAISTTGNYIIGESTGASGTEGFYWTSGSGMVPIGDLTGGIYYSSALGIDQTGSTIVGSSSSTSSGFIYSEAFRWTSGTGMVGLGDLAGGSFNSTATAISNDGTIITGQATSAAGREAYRWTSGTGMVGLGDLAGGSYFSSALGISGDGTTIVGQANSASGYESFYWTSGTGMVALGDLAGGSYYSYARHANLDGTVIVGMSNGASGNEAYRWTSGTGMVGLGDLAGGSFSSEAWSVSNDGSIVVGQGSTVSGTTAFIWDQTNGMRDLNIVLTDLGIDLTGWTLDIAKDVSGNGERVVGQGTYLGNTAAFLAIVSDAVGGVSTPEAIALSLSEAQVSHQQAISQTGVYNSRGLFLARNALSYFPKIISQQQKLQSLATPSLPTMPTMIEPAAGDEEDSTSYLAYDNGYFSPEQWSFYTLGSFAMGQENNPDSHSLDGSVGALYRANKNWIIGAGALSGQSNIDLTNGGKNIIDSYGAEILSSYQHPNGVRLYLVGFASYLTLDSSRGYMNGAGRSYSYGEAEGYGYGGSARLGYEVPVVPDRGFSVTPYIETEYSKTHLNAYTEQQGPFPAAYSEQEGERLIGRVGVELSHNVGDDITLRSRAAYAHRLYDAQNTVTASSTGVTMTLSPNEIDDSWGEGGVSMLWQAQDNLHISADLSGRSGKTEDPYARATIGMTLGF